MSLTDSNIHPSAVIHPTAKLHPSVKIGPYAVVGEQVELGEGCVLDAHAIIQGYCKAGSNNHFFSFTSIGGVTQDLKYYGEETWLHIGDNNIFREFCTVNRGTGHDKVVTTIGNHNTFLAYAHIAHDCVLGDHIIMSNNATLAGHVIVGDYAVLSGFCAVHQFCHIGAYAMIGACCYCSKDVPAFVLVAEKAGAVSPININKTGLKRAGFDSQSIAVLEQAFRVLYRSNLSLKDSLNKIESMMGQDNKKVIGLLLTSIKQSTRGILRK